MTYKMEFVLAKILRLGKLRQLCPKAGSETITKKLTFHKSRTMANFGKKYNNLLNLPIFIDSLTWNRSHSAWP